MLLGPAERQIEFGQTRRRKLDRSPALQDRLNQLWAQEGQTNKTPDVAPADAVAFGQLLQRSHAAGDQLVKPHPSACLFLRHSALGCHSETIVERDG